MGCIVRIDVHTLVWDLFFCAVASCALTRESRILPYRPTLKAKQNETSFRINPPTNKGFLDDESKTNEFKSSNNKKYEQDFSQPHGCWRCKQQKKKRNMDGPVSRMFITRQTNGLTHRINWSTCPTLQCIEEKKQKTNTGGVDGPILPYVAKMGDVGTQSCMHPNRVDSVCVPGVSRSLCLVHRRHNFHALISFPMWTGTEPVLSPFCCDIKVLFLCLSLPQNSFFEQPPINRSFGVHEQESTIFYFFSVPVSFSSCCASYFLFTSLLRSPLYTGLPPHHHLHCILHHNGSPVTTITIPHRQNNSTRLAHSFSPLLDPATTSLYYIP